MTGESRFDIARRLRGIISGTEWRKRHLPGAPLKVTCDPQVQRFVNAAFKTMTFKQIAVACRKRFGAERAPSKSGVHRYWLATLRSRFPDLPRLPRTNSRRARKA